MVNQDATAGEPPPASAQTSTAGTDGRTGPPGSGRSSTANGEVNSAGAGQTSTAGTDSQPASPGSAETSSAPRTGRTPTASDGRTNPSSPGRVSAADSHGETGPPGSGRRPTGRATGSGRVVLDLVERVSATPVGERVEVPVDAADADTVARWCRRAGHQLVAVDDDVAVILRGPLPDDASVLASVPADRRPGTRLWIYTNFDCNLACDYCCAESSPRAERRALGPERIERLVDEGVAHGVSEVFLTGGEPFLLLDLDRIVAACVRRVPTTLLTNGMLFRGRRLTMLRTMPRDGLALQISLDSATPDLHDLHRGGGSWQRALDGIRTAIEEGFRVRVAATVAAGDAGAAEIAAFHALLDELGVERDDQVIRPIAQRGFAETGVALTVESLIPEVTVTAHGVYWHPVAAEHEDQLVTRELFPLGDAIEEVKRRFAAYRRESDAAAQRFTCA